MLASETLCVRMAGSTAGIPLALPAVDATRSPGGLMERREPPVRAGIHEHRVADADSPKDE